MRDIRVYYFLIFVPFILLIALTRKGVISSSEFVILLFLYILYRQFTDAWRLAANGVIKKLSWKILANPMLQCKYFKELYCTK